MKILTLCTIFLLMSTFGLTQSAYIYRDEKSIDWQSIKINEGPNGLMPLNLEGFELAGPVSSILEQTVRLPIIKQPCPPKDTTKPFPPCVTPSPLSGALSRLEGPRRHIFDVQGRLVRTEITGGYGSYERIKIPIVAEYIEYQYDENQNFVGFKRNKSTGETLAQLSINGLSPNEMIFNYQNLRSPYEDYIYVYHFDGRGGFDAQSKLIKKEHLYGYGYDILRKETIEYYYENDLLVQENTYITSESHSLFNFLKQRVNYFYNDQGSISFQEIITFREKDNLQETLRREYIYGSDNVLTKIISSDGSVSSFEYTPDLKLSKVEIVNRYKNSQGENKEIIDTTSYTYTNEGLLTQVLNIVDYKEGKSIKQTDYMEFDQYGNWTKKREINVSSEKALAEELVKTVYPYITRIITYYPEDSQ